MPNLVTVVGENTHILPHMLKHYENIIDKAYVCVYRQSEDDDTADKNDFFDSFLFNRVDSNDFDDTNQNSAENGAKASSASTTWQQYDWYYDSASYYGAQKPPSATDKSDKRSQQNAANGRKTWSRQPVKKTTWEEIRARQKFA